MPENRITQLGGTAAEQGDPNAQVTQEGGTAIIQSSGATLEANVTQLGGTAHIHGNPSARVTQIAGTLFLSPVAPPPPPPTVGSGIFRFDEIAGEEVPWYVIPQLSDSGIELRDKVVKAVRVTGKLTTAAVKVYTYGPKDRIIVEDLEEGVGSKTGAKQLNDTADVVQSERVPVNCPNAMLHTVRVEGVYDGVDPSLDRVDELVYEVAQQGIRR